MNDPRPAAIRVVAGSPTDEETAAVAAVFTQLQLEQAASSRPLPPAQERSAWTGGARPPGARWAAARGWTGA